MGALARMLLGLTHLREVDVSGNSMGDQGVLLLAPLITYSTRLAVIHVGGTWRFVLHGCMGWRCGYGVWA